jgi:hypothetical protein
MPGGGRVPDSAVSTFRILGVQCYMCVSGREARLHRCWVLSAQSVEHMSKGAKVGGCHGARLDGVEAGQLTQCDVCDAACLGACTALVRARRRGSCSNYTSSASHQGSFRRAVVHSRTAMQSTMLTKSITNGNKLLTILKRQTLLPGAGKTPCGCHAEAVEGRTGHLTLLTTEWRTCIQNIITALRKSHDVSTATASSARTSLEFCPGTGATSRADCLATIASGFCACSSHLGLTKKCRDAR